MKSMPLLFMSLTAVGCAAPASQVRAPMIHQTPNHAAVVVRVAMPWYAPRFVVRRKFSQVLGEYEAIPTLAAKYFSISDDREFGGLYLWTSREAADQHFDAAWRANVRAKRGVDADVQTFDAPLVVDGPALPCGTPQGTRALAYPARATWTRWRAAPAAQPALASELAAALAHRAGLIRAFVIADATSIGTIALWVSEDDAERGELRELTARLGRPETIGLEAPLLIDASLHAAQCEAR